MLTMKVTTSREILERVQTLFSTAPDLVNRYTHQEVSPALRHLVDKYLAVYPGPVSYPIWWTSARQRRAFFATNGFGGGIPHRRTGEVPSSWHIKIDYRGGLTSMRVWSTSPASRYVYGPDQQRFHKQTGWQTWIEFQQLAALEMDYFLENGLKWLLREVGL